MNRLASYLMTSALARLFWLFESTIDIRVWGLDKVRLAKRAGERPLLVIWHGKGFIPIAYFHGEDLCLYASHSRDPHYGGLQKAFRGLTLRMIQRLGYRVLDASELSSESRGVIKYIHLLRQGGGGAIAADGPGGPVYQAKPGACFLAKKTGTVLIPVGAAISAGGRLDQWDHFEVPRLFSRAAIVVEEPIHVAEDADEEQLERQRLQLEEALNRANRLAEEKLGIQAQAD